MSSSEIILLEYSGNNATNSPYWTVTILLHVSIDYELQFIGGV
jgi:hypothetical protein